MNIAVWKSSAVLCLGIYFFNQVKSQSLVLTVNMTFEAAVSFFCKSTKVAWKYIAFNIPTDIIIQV